MGLMWGMWSMWGMCGMCGMCGMWSMWGPAFAEASAGKNVVNGVNVVHQAVVF